jgi:hypothetical protein
MRVKAKCSECVSGRRRTVLRKGKRMFPEMEGGQKVTEMKADFGIQHSWCIKCRSEQSLTVHYPAPGISMPRMCVYVCACVRVHGRRVDSISVGESDLRNSKCHNAWQSTAVCPSLSPETSFDRFVSDVACFNVGHDKHMSPTCKKSHLIKCVKLCCIDETSNGPAHQVTWQGCKHV